VPRGDQTRWALAGSDEGEISARGYEEAQQPRRDGIREIDENAAAVAGIGAALEKPARDEVRDPAQRRRLRHPGREAELRHGNRSTLDASEEQLQHHVPGGIGEEVGAE